MRVLSGPVDRARGRSLFLRFVHWFFSRPDRREW